MIAHGIITAPRPRRTIERSLASLRLAGFDGEILVSSDDPNELQIEGARVIANPSVRGNFRNWLQCLDLLISSDQPWMCISEDDVTWAPNCRLALEQDLRDLSWTSILRRSGALSLYFPIAMSNEVEAGKILQPGWHEATRGIKTWGAQCFLFSREMATNLLESPHMAEYVADPKWTKNVDGIVADVLAKHSLSILYRVPCLVNHDLGEANSSLGYPDDRPKLKTRYYTGAA